MSIDEQLHELAKKYLKLITSEDNFDKRERLLAEHQEEHNYLLAKKKQKE